MREWLRLATDRSTDVAAAVDSVLIVINHGDAILRGDLSRGRLLRMGLTALVPYGVSTYSSVGHFVTCSGTAPLGTKTSARSPKFPRVVR
jgi:hypothetical protein